MITILCPLNQDLTPGYHGRIGKVSKSLSLAVMMTVVVGCGGADSAESSKFQQALQEFLAPTGIVQVQVMDGITPTLINEAKTDIANGTGFDFLPGTTLAALQVPEIAQKCSENPCVSGDKCLGQSSSWSIDFGCLCAQSGQCVGNGVLTQTVENNLADGCVFGVVSLYYDKVRYVRPDIVFVADGEALAVGSDCGASGSPEQSFNASWYDLRLNNKSLRGGRRHFVAKKEPEVLVYVPNGSYVISDTVTDFSKEIVIRGADGIADCKIDQSGCGVCTGRGHSDQWSVCGVPK